MLRQASCSRLLHAGALLSAVLGAAACTAESGAPVASAPEAVASSTSPRVDSLERSRDSAALQVARLKSAIRSIALANQTRTDNLPQVKRALDPLIARLVALSPRLDNAEKLARSVGPWRNLWSNLDYGDFPPDLTRVFQIVTDKGHYWNLSQAVAPVPGGGPVISALRGAYAPIPAGLAIRFTADGLVPGPLSGRTGADLVTLADAIEDGTVPLIPLPGGGIAPLRITGTLTTAYVDDDLRIIGGEATPRFDDHGVIEVPGQFDLLFVLDRQTGRVE